MEIWKYYKSYRYLVINKFPVVKIKGNKVSRRTNPMSFIYCQAQLQLKIYVGFVHSQQFMLFIILFINAYNTLHIKQCIENNAENTMHWIQCIEYNGYNTMNRLQGI